MLQRSDISIENPEQVFARAPEERNIYSLQRSKIFIEKSVFARAPEERHICSLQWSDISIASRGAKYL
jgi:hypothetical protein